MEDDDDAGNMNIIQSVAHDSEHSPIQGSARGRAAGRVCLTPMSILVLTSASRMTRVGETHDTY